MTGFATICLLSYNRPQFVVGAIQSATDCAEYPVEVIVHDDGSDAETRNQLLALRDEGLISTLILNAPGHNEGQGIALNRMFAMAKGDPIIKMDHDLLFQRGWLRQSVSILRANQTIGALGLFKYRADPVRWQDKLIRSHDRWDEVEDFVGSCMVIPRRAWDTFGPFEERSVAFAEDMVFKKRVHEAEGWCCALTAEDLALNRGFGPGPSTVVHQKADGSIGVASIKDGPMVIDLG